MSDVCPKIIRLLLSLAFCFIFFTIPAKTFAFDYVRTPTGSSITSPVSIDFSFSDISDLGWTDATHYFIDIEGRSGSIFGICHSISENEISENFNLPSGFKSYGVYLVGSVSDDCSTSGENLELEVNGGEIIFTISVSGATPTPSAGSPTATPTTAATPTTRTIFITVTPTPTPIPLKDAVAPVISIATDFSKPFKEAPKISGKASDAGAINVGVTKVEYSIDDGKNWLPVDTIDNPGAKVTSFSFTPVIFEDGNYKLRARAKDPTGNVGASGIYTLVIDRLPPQVGGSLFSLGPQVLIPTKEGLIFTLQGLETKITLSAVGGPLTIDLTSGTQMFSLHKNIDNGLWSGILSFTKPGVYELTAKAIDGAGNKTERQLNTILVLDSGKILNGTSPVASGNVTLWYFDSQTQRFVVWDGAPYGQSNPRKITRNGEYGFFAPNGKYYLEIKSYGFKTLHTEIFTLSASTPITTPLKLERSFGIQLGPFFLALPDFSVSRQSISIQSPVIPAKAKAVNNALGSEFPNVDLFLDAKKVSTVFLRGKPTVFTFLSTWSPYTSQQLNSMGELTNNSSVNILPVISQETASSVSIFKKRGGYSFPIYADPDGLLVNPLNLSFSPTNVFVDRKGIIQKMKVGVLTKEELLENMVN